MPSVFAEVAQDAYCTYRAELQVDYRLMAGNPKDPKLIEGWIRSKAGVSDELEVLEMMRRHLREMGVEVADDATFDTLVQASAEIADERHTCGFKTNGHGPYIESRQVKALLKEATNILFAGKEKWGKTNKGPKNYLAERVFVQPRELLLGREFPDGVEAFTGHVSGAQGPRATLTYYEYAEGPRLAFDVQVLDDCLTPEQWAKIWTLAENLGLGALRSQGFGTFTVEKWERVT